MITIEVPGYADSAKKREDLHFFLVDFSNGYHIKLRPMAAYETERSRWERNIYDIDALVDSNTYSVNDEMFKMIHPGFDIDLIKRMIKEFEGRDYYQMYHGSQDDKFWKNPKKALAEMNPKCRKPYTLDECYEIMRKVI